MTSTATAGQWAVLLRSATGAPHGRVVVVPHAGAGPNALMSLFELLPQRYEIVGITLPGRERRFTEAFTTTPSDPPAVAAAVLAEIALLPELPTVLFGHSMGAALAGAMAVAEPGAFVRVVLSAYPSTGTPAQLAGRWPDGELLDILRRGEGTPDEILRSPFWRRHILDRLRSDLTLGVRLAHVGVQDTLQVPLTVLSGDRDEIVPDYGAAAWRARAGAGLRMRAFPGAHFYLLDDLNRAGVAGEIAEAFTTGLGDTGPVHDAFAVLAAERERIALAVVDEIGTDEGALRVA